MQLVRHKSKTPEKALSLFIILQLTLPAFSDSIVPPNVMFLGGFKLGDDPKNPGYGELGGPDDPHAPNETTKANIMQLPTVQGAIGAIGGLNSAMEQAAQNPNEEWRREKVRQAIRAVPPAIQALAGTFSSHVMGNSALPFVLSMMGGFVDVNAPKAFDKFLKNPSPDLIPKLGPGFPKDKDYSDVSITLKEEAPRPLDTPTAKVAVGTSTPANDIVSVGPSTQIVIKETPKTAPVSQETAVSSQKEEPSSVVNTLTEDIAIAESVLNQSRGPASSASIVAPVLSEEAKKALEEKKEEDEEFFSEKEKKEEKKPETQRSLSGKKRDVELKVLKPTSRLLAPLFWLGTIWGEQEALAAPAAPTNPQGENGAQGSQVLTGVAAIISAFATMQVAGTESQKEQAVAQIQADAQVTQAEIQSSTQREMAELSSKTALEQAQMSKEVAQMNNAAQTQRLQMNLLAAQEQRNFDRQMQREQLQMQQYLEAQKLALAERQMEVTAQLSRELQETKNLNSALGKSESAPASNGVVQSIRKAMEDVFSQDVTLSPKGTKAKQGTKKNNPSRSLLSAALSDTENNQISEKIMPLSAKLSRGLSKRLGRKGLL